MAAEDTITLVAVGDVGPRRADPEYPVHDPIFAHCADIIKKADISFCNFERILTARHERKDWYDCVVDPGNVRELTHAGFTVANVATNHHMDAGVESFVDTLETLKKNGIKPIGGGMNIAEARTPVIIERKGTKVAFLGYSSVIPKTVMPYEAEEDRPGCAPMYVTTFYQATDWQPGTPAPKIITLPDEDDLAAMIDDIHKAKAQADLVVMSFHWGVHFVPGLIAKYQHDVGRAAIDAGADLILGHHPHILKGIEVYNGKVIFHSLANFGHDFFWGKKALSDRWHSSLKPDATSEFRREYPTISWSGDHMKTIMARILISDKKITRVSFVPFFPNKLGQPELQPHGSKMSDDIYDYMVWCCRDQKMQTKLVREGDEILVVTS